MCCRHVLKPRQHTRAPRAAIKQRIRLLPTTPNVLTTKRHTSLQIVAAAAEQLLLRTVAVKSSKEELTQFNYRDVELQPTIVVVRRCLEGLGRITRM